MSDQVVPFLRCVFTDLTGAMLSEQMLGNCANQEMAAMECLEAYGVDRGLQKCRLLMEDFFECQTRKKQYMRFLAMRRERNRQIACGKLTGDKQYVTPKLDSY